MNQTPYHARQRRRDKNAAWAVNAQARLKAFEERKKMTSKLVSALDNGGKSFDRYTLCFQDDDGVHYTYAVSENPNSPMGFGQFSGNFYVPPDHNSPVLGSPVDFDALPAKVQGFIQRMQDN